MQKAKPKTSAIAVSDNIFAVKTHLFLGTENLRDFLKSYGINAKNNASLALGTVNTNIYNLSNIYCNIASGGKYQHLYTIEKIVDHQGKTIYQHKNQRIQNLNKESCLILNQLLTGTFNKQFSTYLNAANEEAIASFIKGQLSFLSIFDVVEETLTQWTSRHIHSLSDVLEADKEARRFAKKIINRGILC